MKVLCQREIDFLALNIIKMRLNECFEKINWGKLHRFRIESNCLWNNYDLNNYSTKNAGPELNSRACDETQASYLRKERTYSLQRSHRLHPPAGARAPGAAPGQRHLPRRNHLHPPLPPEGALLSPHTPLVFTTPTWHFPNPLPAGISSHWGDRHTHTLLEAPASPPASCTGGEYPTLSRRDAPARSPDGPRSRRRHLRWGRSRAQLHFQPPVSSKDGPQRRGALEAHRKSSHPLRPEMTSWDPTWPALCPPSLAQPSSNILKA